MGWKRLALRNSLGNARRYLGYILSSSLAVMVFFLFASFVHNPHVAQGYMTKNAKALMDLCRYIVVVFAVFFIFFFHSSLIRLRNREFGLFIVLGMTPRQVGRLILYESLLIGALSIGIGTILGILFSKLFLMAVGALLQVTDPIPFLIPMQAVEYTLLFFGAVFLFDAIWVAVRVRTRTPRLLLIGDRVHQKQPRVRIVLAILGLLCLVLGYYYATEKSREFVSNVLPILVLTSIGTYLLFTQLSVFVLTRLRNRSLSGQSMILVSRLAFRMKDYARMLTVVTLLTAMVLTGMGAVFSVKHVMNENSIRTNPYTVQMIGLTADPNALQIKLITQQLRAQHISITKEVQIDLITGTLRGTYLPILQKAFAKQPPIVTILSYSNYEQLRKTLYVSYPELQKYLQPDVPLQAGSAHFYLGYPNDMGGDIFQSKDVALSVGSSTWKLTIDGEKKTRVLNQSLGGIPEYILVVRDDLYQYITGKANENQRWSVHGWISNDWKNSKPAIDHIKQSLPLGQQSVMTNTVVPYSDSQQILSVMMFAGFFVSILFILASGTTIYFRLFSQQEEDARQFGALQRIGLSKKEIGNVITFEFFLLFFIPFAVAIVHSIFAMIDLQHLLTVEGSVWAPFGLVVAICFVCYLLYFGVSRIRYAKKVSIY